MSEQASLLAFAAQVAATGDLLDQEPVVSDAYRRVFATEPGRLVLMDLFARHQIMSRSFLPGVAHADAAYLDGIKACVSEILTKALTPSHDFTARPEGDDGDHRDPD